MARTKEAVDITPGTKSKTAELGKIKGIALKTPISYTGSWVVPTVDELVSELSSNPDSVLSEIATARQDAAMAEARAKAISDSEPRELKVEKFVKQAVKMGMDADSAKAFAEANIPQ